ncbi:autophagy-related protein 22 [Saccharata proteae CBS 121410]|uniref:Autophagy-related protein n=1 Tax=Saccharata proteae CBS 121410 TaxID=1314787 RepID=A0A9P4HQ04_9PEZI|nr:autophagy-related protein 22 [Saccharata proteae CBS 121410]
MVPRVPATSALPLDDPPPLPPQLHRQTSSASKRSLSFPSSSYSADDERSIMGPEFNSRGGRRRQTYPGEDTSLTSRKELSGFYVYGWAAEVFVVCGVGSFIPITLEQLARDRGVLLSDRKTPCTPILNNPLDPPHDVYALSPSPESEQCVVSLFGLEINTASFALYTFSLSVLIQALLIISMSGAADHGRWRKTLLLVFAFTGSIATMLFLPIVPKVYLIGALLAIIANTCFGASFVLLNSFLPLLVRHHPETECAYREAEDADYFEEDDHAALAEPVLDAPDETAALLGRQITQESDPISVPSPELTLSTRISSYGIGIGYIAALIVQTLGIFLVLTTGSTTFSLRLVLFVVGAWWFVFTIPTIFWLRPRPGPPLSTASGTTRSWFAYFSYSWKSLGKTVVRARKLKDILLFLGAWFLLSDAIATVSGTAVLFAKTSLEMKPAALALINVIATLSGIVGAFSWSRLSHLMNLRPSQTVLACILLFEIIPIYGLLGYIPAIRNLGVFGLQQPWEMYPLGAVYGFVLGGLSSYCRAVFGEMVPPGAEAQFYALYAITDKGSSIFGPAVVGAITDATGEIRPAFWFLAVLIGLPFPVMLFVDVERGRTEGIELARELDEAKGKTSERRSSENEYSDNGSLQSGEGEGDTTTGEPRGHADREDV